MMTLNIFQLSEIKLTHCKYIYIFYECLFQVYGYWEFSELVLPKRELNR